MADESLRLTAHQHRRKAPIDGLLQPLQRFMEIEASGGILLLLCTLFALVMANTSLAQWYQSIWEIPIAVHWDDWVLQKDLIHVINDGLMCFFFFVVGLEIKREFISGELQKGNLALLPFAAALGGMLLPAALYLLIEGGKPGQSGWGIPMATDIAFVVGFLSLLGRRVPPGLKVLILALAIIDDIGAVLVIAFFYTQDISLVALLWAGFGLGLVALVQRLGIRNLAIYVLLTALVWYALLKSGVHPTLAGVALGLLTPSTPWVPEPGLIAFLRAYLSARHSKNAKEEDSTALRVELARLSAEAVAPAEKLLTTLHPWVAFVILPLFALANAGVPVELNSLQFSTPWAVAIGLLLGKPLGILLFSYLAVRMNLGKLPPGVDWRAMLGLGFLGGIGFTMSLFMANLALSGATLVGAKVGTLLGSCLSAVIGLLILHKVLVNRVSVEGP